MHESTAQNGYQPVERLADPGGHERPADRFAEEFLRPLVEREVTRQLEPAKTRWSLGDYLHVVYTLAWWAALVSVGFVLGGAR